MKSLLSCFRIFAAMDFNTFAQHRNDCYTAEDGFLLWRLAEGAPFAPSVFEEGEGRLISHILVCGGELVVEHGGCAYTLAACSFGSFVDRPRIGLLSASADIDAYVMVLKDAYVDALLKNDPPIPFSYVLKMRMNPVEAIGEDTRRLFRRRMEAIKDACLDACNFFRDKMIKCTIWMLFMDIADRYLRSGGSKDPAGKTDRAMQLFSGFMRLLPAHAAAEHFAGYYADRLCVTPQYLNRVVKALSGRTVSGWISFTLVGEITKRLENTHESMQQIAADLHFPDQATLTKFYKRETGYSLMEYKKKRT